jgi:hypothetical protein
VLKDLATPQLKGMGIFFVLFGVGLLAAIINYASIAFSVMVATGDIKVSSAAYRTAIWVTVFGALGGLVGLGTLVAAIIIVIARFSSL